jgi:cell division protein FtsN
MLKNFEIKLNRTHSILLIISIFTIGILSFALGFQIGKNTPPDMVALENDSQETPGKTFQTEKGDRDVAKSPLPTATQGQEASTEKLGSKEIKEGELTFFKTLPDAKRDNGKKMKLEKHEKEVQVPLLKTADSTLPTIKQDSIPASLSKPSVINAPLFYTVQVGSFKTKDEALNLKSKLDKKGYQSYITTFDNHNEKWFRVRIGQFKTRDQAESSAKRLKSEEGLTSFIAASK